MTWLGFCPQLLLANTNTVAAPALPVQQASEPLSVDSQEHLLLVVQLSEIKGDVSVQKQGTQNFQAISADTKLSMGDTIKTGDGSCRVSIDGKSQLALQANSTLRITEALRNRKNQDDSTKLLLQNGKLMVKLPKLKQGSSFEVNTPTAVAVVRGTTFYLNVGIYQGKDNTQMYVDESKGGVLFKNILNGKELLVPAFSLSNAFNDGRLDEPRQLTAEQKEAFIQNFETNSGSGANQQFGIEELPTPNALPPAPPIQDVLKDILPDTTNEGQISDAVLDKLAEQNISELNGFTPPPSLSNPGFVPPTDDNTNPPKDDTNPPKDDTGGNGNTGGNGGTDVPVVTDEDKGIILEEVGNILDDQNFDFLDANQAVAQDAQTGKVFTDVHGNRVRTDQYIFHQNTDVAEAGSLSSVVLLSITQRAGEYQNGVSAFWFQTIFNRALTDADGPIRDLPWNDWMNVVTKDELTNVSLPDGLPAEFDQYIVHEHFSGGANGPDLYPAAIIGVFTSGEQPNAANPIRGSVLFGEFYTDPLLASSDQGNFWVQGLFGDITAITTSNGENILSLNLGGEGFASLNGETISYLDRSGFQTTGFSSHTRLGELDTEDGINYFKGNSIHPAFFEQQYGENRFLYGSFLPINDQGQVIDAPGFNVHGLRDLVHPNRLVNGGNYNLEVLWVYGIGDADSFQEQFRIDTIITPEIFGDFGLKGPSGIVDRSTIFPASLDDDSQNF